MDLRGSQVILVPPNCLINVVLPRQEGKAEQRWLSFLDRVWPTSWGSTSLVTEVVPFIGLLQFRRSLVQR